ncbi:MAG: FliI/YscN family ATPase [Clostridia bacterium]|nr:FliI/YscN family ATPase [Clostridia bacterium]MDQ7792515.1 FliI/YscN family ATPase [Clostridia bacterium]
MAGTTIEVDLSVYHERLRGVRLVRRLGQVTKVIGLTIEVVGADAFIGETCDIFLPGDVPPVLAEVVGFKGQTALLMPLGDLQGVRPGCRVKARGQVLTVRVGEHLLGQVLDGLGRPTRGVSVEGLEFSVNNPPPDPLARRRITEVMPTGVRAIDGFLTCGRGQRTGIFAGSGVGKSVLLGMLCRYCASDVNVVALVGERGREVLDFIERDLGSALKRSVVVVATSDQPALVRLRAAFVATAIAEYFRDQGRDVLLLMDSVTRFAYAQREIGLAVGEPPTTRGYTPSVFALLPRLLERAGTSRQGSITGFYTVLVEGDDMQEPVADTVRSILDGHIVLSRELGVRNHFPAIDVLHSASRLFPDITDQEHKVSAGRVRSLLATYDKSEDLVNIGAYVTGSNPMIDLAVEKNPVIVDFLKQDMNEFSAFDDTIARLRALAGKEESDGPV